MAADIIKYDTGAADSINAGLVATAKELQSAITDVIQACKPLMEIWMRDGDPNQAGTRSLERQRLLQQKSDEIVQVVTAFGNTVNENTDLARATDQQLANTLFA